MITYIESSQKNFRAQQTRVWLPALQVIVYKLSRFLLSCPWPTVFARPHIMHFERKNSRPDISILTVYEITPTTILKHVFHETTHEEVCIRIKKHQISIKLDFYKTFYC